MELLYPNTFMKFNQLDYESELFIQLMPCNLTKGCKNMSEVVRYFEY